jgi:glycosyltransferase involved in cell wall biosynthesis
MKLIYISEGNIPSLAANSIQIMKMSQAFAELLPSFELVTLGDIHSLLSRKQFDFCTWYGISNSFKITRLPFLLRSSYPFPANYRLRGFAKLAAIYVRWRRPDVVYTRSESAARIALRLGLRTIVETHAPASSKSWYWRYFNKGVSNRLLGLVTISSGLAESYVATGVPSEKVMVARDGVDIERFDITMTKDVSRQTLNLPVESRIAVYVGHLYDNRGIEEIFAVAEKARDVLFLLVGGWEKDVMRRREEAKRRKLTNVRIPGFVPNAQVPLYLSASDVLLMPYSQYVNTVRWMSPMKMFEYMAAGKPILATDLPPIREVLHDGHNAVLVAPDDSSALLDGLNTLLHDPALMNRVASRAFQDVQIYTWRKRAERILTFFSNG